MPWRLGVLFIVWFICLALYVAFGGLVFEALEYEDYIRSEDLAATVYEEFLNNHTDLTLDDIMEIIRISKLNSITLPDEKAEAAEWDIGNSMFFCVSVITAVGYGNLYPESTGGRIFFVFYALLGMPFAYAFLYRLGKEMFKINGNFLDSLKISDNPDYNTAFRVIVTIFFTMLVYFVIPSIIFDHAEDWDFGTAVYYTFNTMLTIGFGDTVAGYEEDEDNWYKWYRLYVAVWLFTGLAWIIGLLTGVAEIIAGKIDEKFEEANKDKLDPENKKKEPNETTPILQDEHKPQDKEEDVEA